MSRYIFGSLKGGMVAAQRWLLVGPSAKKLSDLRRRQSPGKPLAMSTKVANPMV